MSNIAKEKYEFSLWKDYFSNGARFEQKVVVLGSDTMTSQNRGQEPVFKEKTDGTHTFTFKMYYRYEDIETGEMVDNPLTKLIINESKIKLFYRNQWYDFLVKKINENSQDYSFSYELTDSYINELSKTGFNLVFDTELENNIGTIKELGAKVLEGTEWTVDTNSEIITSVEKENLFSMSVQGLSAYLMTREATGAVKISSTATSITGTIYAFYSCCANKEKRFQFIYLNGATPQIDSERVILNGQQYCTNNVIYSNTQQYGIYPLSGATNVSFSDYKGEKFSYVQVTKINPVLDKVVKKYQSINDPNDVYWGYSETKYYSPNLIQNFITNNTNYNTRDGWKLVPVGSVAEVPLLELKTVNDISEWLKHNPSSTTYTPGDAFLGASLTNTNLRLLNSGFFDQRGRIESLNQGETFVCLIKASTSNNNYNIDKKLKVKLQSFVRNGEIYNPIDTDTYLEFRTFQVYDSDTNYYYSTASVSKGLSKEKYLDEVSKLWVSIEPFNESPDTGLGIYKIFDLQIFRFGGEENGKPLTPKTQDVQAKAVTTYYYYEDPAPATLDEYSFITTNNPNPQDVGLFETYQDDCEKIRTISIKESNRFNIIQTLCETFKCWVQFNVEHDSLGNTTSKKVKFVNYVGQDNPIDFVYGIDVSTISRALDSNSVVTKLIVKDNSNEFADNGFCSIQRATNNPTGENYIIDFGYYINKGLLDGQEFYNDLYLTTAPYLGYYVNIKDLNNQLQDLDERLIKISNSLVRAKADVSFYDKEITKAQQEYDSINQTLKRNYNWSYVEICSSTSGTIPTRNEIVQRITYDPTFQDYLEKIAQYDGVIRENTIKLDQARVALAAYEGEATLIKGQMAALITQKANLNGAFFRKYSQFIQEGVWQEESYTNPNLYYYDGQSSAYENSRPRVDYQVNVLNLLALDEYKDRKFSLGDRTYIQDTEFFGYTTVTTTIRIKNNDDTYTYVTKSTKTPAREGIIITEITYNFDNPEKDSFLVKVYGDKFEDLFQRINATIQSVQLSTGAYQKAADLAESDERARVEFLQDALNDASVILENMADQTVEWDTNGITITDGANQGQKLRLVSGGLLLTEDGGATWTLGITSKGISASKITSGQLDTALIQIMNGREAYFRWDAFGLTAYDFALDSQGNLSSVNTFKGTRFDRFGFYGFDGIDGTIWHPTSINQSGDSESIDKHALFYLTWDGLKIRLNNTDYQSPIDPTGRMKITDNNEKVPYAYLGKVDDDIYNKWNNGGIPAYDTTLTGASNFVRLMAVGNATNGARNDMFCLYSDGTLVAKNIKLTGSIEWATAASPYLIVYTADPTDTAPAPGTTYNQFPNTGVHWHKELQSNDIHFANTTDGGNTWLGPFLIKGESGVGIASILTEYAVSSSQVSDPSSLSYDPDYPIVAQGQYLYKKTTITYTDSTQASPHQYIYYDESYDGEDGQQGPQGPDGPAGKHGTDVEFQDIFYRKNSFGDPSPLPSSWVTTNSQVNNQWTTYELNGTSSYEYVYRCTQKKSTSYDTTPETVTLENQNLVLIRAYNLNNAVSQETYAEFLILTNGQQNNGMYYGSQGNLLINADYIQTGALEIINSNNDTIFSASKYNNSVSIAGFTVSGTRFYSGSKATLDDPNTGVYIGTDGIALGAGDIITGKSAFQVTSAGALYCTSADITGSITATSGTIGGCQIQGGVLKVPVANIDGQITATSLLIKNGSGSSAQILLDAGATSVNQVNIGGFTVTPTSLYNGLTSVTGTTNGVYVGIDGIGIYKNGSYIRLNGSNGSINCNYGTIGNWTLNNSLSHSYNTSNFLYDTFIGDNYNIIKVIRNDFPPVPQSEITIFQLDYTGNILMKESYIDIYKQSTDRIDTLIDSTSINFYYTPYGGIGEQHSILFHIPTNHAPGSYMQLTGTWNDANGNTITSDLRKKKDISNYSDYYNRFFDLLKPRIFKFKDGTSDRIHTGFIAQEVKSAINQAGLTTQDFAAYCELDEDTFALRYHEFVSLNTWQIQLLKKRVSELEAKINELQSQN